MGSGGELFCRSISGVTFCLGVRVTVEHWETADVMIMAGRKSWTAKMNTVYDFVTVICFIFAVLTFFMFTQGGMRVLAHFMLPAAAFAIANQVGNHAGNNAPMNVLAVILIAAGIGYIYIIVKH